MRSPCPINYALETFGDKWSLLIMRDLIFMEKRHYNEFFESKEKISTSVLGDRLKQLENIGIIHKGKDEVKKSRIKYSLTRKGIDMLPILIDIIVWSSHHTGLKPGVDILDDAINNRESLINSLKIKLEAEHLNLN
mgnify:CR=1 FL=1